MVTCEVAYISHKTHSAWHTVHTVIILSGQIIPTQKERRDQQQRPASLIRFHHLIESSPLSWLRYMNKLQLQKVSHYKFDSMLNSPTESTLTFQRWACLAPTSYKSQQISHCQCLSKQYQQPLLWPLDTSKTEALSFYHEEWTAGQQKFQ